MVSTTSFRSLNPALFLFTLFQSLPNFLTCLFLVFLLGLLRSLDVHLVVILACMLLFILPTCSVPFCGKTFAILIVYLIFALFLMLSSLILSFVTTFRITLSMLLSASAASFIVSAP